MYGVILLKEHSSCYGCTDKGAVSLVVVLVNFQFILQFASAPSSLFLRQLSQPLYFLQAFFHNLSCLAVCACMRACIWK